MCKAVASSLVLVQYRNDYLVKAASTTKQGAEVELVNAISLLDVTQLPL